MPSTVAVAHGEVSKDERNTKDLSPEDAGKGRDTGNKKEECNDGACEKAAAESDAFLAGVWFVAVVH